MNVKAFNARIAMLSADNKSMRIANLVMAIVIAFLCYVVSQKNETLIVIPPQIDKPFKVAKSQADKNFKILWGRAFASLAGNITPKNAANVAETIGAYLSSEVYHKVAGELGNQVYKIQQEGRTTRFIVNETGYEPETDIVFVEGDFYVSTDLTPNAGMRKGKEVPRQKVYEFRVDVSEGTPRLTHFDSYLGERRDQEYYARQKAIEEQLSGTN